MTVATVAQPSGNTFAVLYVMVILVGFITVVVLISHERRGDRQDVRLDTHAGKIDGLDYRLESLLEFLGVEVPEPIEDDSPEAMAEPDDDTDEFPALPATVPDGIPLAVQSALIERPTHELMTPETAEKQRVARAAFVEEQLARFDFSGRSK